MARRIPGDFIKPFMIRRRSIETSENIVKIGKASGTPEATTNEIIRPLVERATKANSQIKTAVGRRYSGIQNVRANREMNLPKAQSVEGGPASKAPLRVSSESSIARDAIHEQPIRLEEAPHGPTVRMRVRGVGKIVDPGTGEALGAVANVYGMVKDLNAAKKSASSGQRNEVTSGPLGPGYVRKGPRSKRKA